MNYPLIAHRSITFRDPLEGDVLKLHPSALRKGDEGRIKSRTFPDRSLRAGDSGASRAVLRFRESIRIGDGRNPSRCSTEQIQPLKEYFHSSKVSGATPAGALARPHGNAALIKLTKAQTMSAHNPKTFTRTILVLAKLGGYCRGPRLGAPQSGD